jgi:hypothetical protein
LTDLREIVLNMMPMTFFRPGCCFTSLATVYVLEVGVTMYDFEGLRMAV